jgi:hypothetical protein
MPDAWMQNPHYSRSASDLSGRCCRSIAAVLLAALSMVGWGQSGGGGRLAAAVVEAAYLYNFGKFVRFPAGDAQNAPMFSICILGDDGIGAPLDNLIVNESIQGRKIVTRRLTTAADTGTCQIVYIGQMEEERLERNLAALAGKPVLTVSGIPGFLDRGGMIQFILQDKRVRFAVNLTAAEQPHLELSSELLKVATHVDAKPAGEAK